MSFKQTLLGGVLVALPGMALAAPEGTRQLGLTQGLEGNSILQVFANEGETIRVCSSDNGTQEANVTVNGNAVRIDIAAGMPNPVPDNRRGSEILISPPQDTVCGRDADCQGGLTCRSVQDGSAYNGGQPIGICARAVAVTNNSGHRNAAQPEANRN
ncbi:MAG: hypothetical protein R3F43_14940 [bacterium]